MASDNMKKAILEFPQQFAFRPEVKNTDLLVRKHHTAVLGMGGSQLAADVLRAWKPSLSLINHRDYGLPALSDHEAQNTLFIASSYSGNTEETISGYQETKKRGYALAVSTVGGKILELAQADRVPYVQLPNTGIQPRMALGFGTLSLLTLMGETDGVTEAATVSTMATDGLEAAGKALAERLYGKVPIIYASNRNQPIAYNWKIKLNETGKIPAFCNTLPELNHNEMTGFDVQPSTKALSSPFHVLVLRDKEDDRRIQKRMDALKSLYEQRGIPVDEFSFGGTGFVKIMCCLLVADWFAYYTAEQYGAEAEQVPMVEEFKRMIAA